MPHLVRLYTVSVSSFCKLFLWPKTRALRSIKLDTTSLIKRKQPLISGNSLAAHENNPQIVGRSQRLSSTFRKERGRKMSYEKGKETNLKEKACGHV